MLGHFEIDQFSVLININWLIITNNVYNVTMLNEHLNDNTFLCLHTKNMNDKGIKMANEMADAPLSFDISVIGVNKSADQCWHEIHSSVHCKYLIIYFDFNWNRNRRKHKYFKQTHCDSWCRRIMTMELCLLMNLIFIFTSCLNTVYFYVFYFLTIFCPKRKLKKINPVQL